MRLRPFSMFGIWRALVVCFSASALVTAVGCGSPSTKPPEARTTAFNVEPTPVPMKEVAKPPIQYLLHLPGIGGTRSIDDEMVDGLVKGGFNGKFDIIDWTANDPGIAALEAYARNKKKAGEIAKDLTAKFDADPTSKIFVSSHSGGGGLAVWVLEALPPRVRVENVILMSPALSPGYDLTPALRHVSGKLYVFSSLQDEAVLGLGCRMFGTMDGKKCDAAGRVGFVKPASADPVQYQKLVAMPYKVDWVRFGNMGNHIGGMTTAFGNVILAPLLLGQLTISTTRPAVR